MDDLSSTTHTGRHHAEDSDGDAYVGRRRVAQVRLWGRDLSYAALVEVQVTGELHSVRAAGFEQLHGVLHVLLEGLLQLRAVTKAGKKNGEVVTNGNKKISFTNTNK